MVATSFWKRVEVVNRKLLVGAIRCPPGVKKLKVFGSRVVNHAVIYINGEKWDWNGSEVCRKFSDEHAVVDWSPGVCFAFCAAVYYAKRAGLSNREINDMSLIELLDRFLVVVDRNFNRITESQFNFYA